MELKRHIMSTNIRFAYNLIIFKCLIGILFHLHDFIYSRPVAPLIFGIVETWFNSTVPDVSLNELSYSILRNDRPIH